MSTKGDARSEVPSSAARYFARVRTSCERYAGLGVAGFVGFHLAWQAFRASRDGALPDAGFETEPGFVLAMLLVIWVPFCISSWGKLSPNRRLRSPGTTEKAQALAVLTLFTHWLVLLFLALHLTQVVWPLLDGEQTPGDARPELVALLSSTQHGAPLVAAGYLCGVGAASFFGVREVLRALGPAPKPRYARGAILCGVLAYLLGSYAVIRCAGGVILP